MIHFHSGFLFLLSLAAAKRITNVINLECGKVTFLTPSLNDDSIT